MARSRSRDPPPTRRALARAALVAALACAAFPPAFASEDAETRRARKEAFHSGNAGTTFLEVSAVVAAAQNAAKTPSRAALLAPFGSPAPTCAPTATDVATIAPAWDLER